MNYPVVSILNLDTHIASPDIGAMCKRLRESGLPAVDPKLFNYAIIDGMAVPTHPDRVNVGQGLAVYTCIFHNTHVNINTLPSIVKWSEDNEIGYEMTEIMSYTPLDMPYVQLDTHTIEFNSTDILENYTSSAYKKRYEVRKALSRIKELGLHVRELEPLSMKLLNSWIPICEKRFGDTFSIEAMCVIQALRDTTDLHILGIYNSEGILLSILMHTRSYSNTNDNLWQFQTYFAVSDEDFGKHALLLSAQWLCGKYGNITLDTTTAANYLGYFNNFQVYKKTVSNGKKPVYCHTITSNVEFDPPFTLIDSTTLEVSFYKDGTSL